ncbi:TrmH family RNA methyltransferase [Aureitalea marina]|uniref:tRNA/rRNA methyltransferase SpoU type domain-containing protein n=1 Tax=Aureitalea marina TaxID=930804 RepID=A0A2S7KNZ2_9FLAO|nr:TrmH family RNA methyltransferase [Aureitalea marina]PQB04346.1 hypothetical protein BST85_05120 [Aureitalea marina]
MTQLNHDQVVRHQPSFSLTLVCDGVNGPANIGSILRLADGLGVKEVVFANASINTDSDRLRRTARGAEKWMTFREESDLPRFLQEKLNQGAHVLALEITKESRPIKEFQLAQLNGETIFIIGAENRGVSQEVLEMAGDQVYHLPLYGRNSSINVAQAAAIGLYCVVQQLEQE